ncbi:MAG: hypothetical protein AB7P40_17735 [Chloroflexota bacterium]
MLKQKKTRIAAAGASVALAAAIVGAGFAVPTNAAWAATSVPGFEQLQQATGTPAAPPATRPGRQGQRPGGNYQQREQMREAYQNALAGRLGVSADQLKEASKLAHIDVVNQAVADGKITQAQADRMIQSIQNGTGPGGFGIGQRGQGPGMRQGQGQGQGPRGQKPGMGQRGQGPGAGQGAGFRGGPGAGFRAGPVAVAEFLGMTPDELRTEMQAGKSLAQVAEAKGISRDQLKAKLLELHMARINEAVAAGRMTQEQAQQATERMTANLDSMLDRTPGQGQGPRGPRAGN